MRTEDIGVELSFWSTSTAQQRLAPVKETMLQCHWGEGFNRLLLAADAAAACMMCACLRVFACVFFHHLLVYSPNILGRERLSEPLVMARV